MNFQFILILLAVFLVVWTSGTYFFWRISQTTKAKKAAEGVQPAIRLAEQWIVESQQKIEKLIEDAEQPLSMAQHELLDLRLEAGRLPQGVKNLRSVREALNGSIRPADLNKTLADILALYLDRSDHYADEKGRVYLKTSMGDIPCVEASPYAKASGDRSIQSAGFSDAEMKGWMAQLASFGTVNPVAGGFIYFPQESHFKLCQENKEWMEALRNRKFIAVDLKGLTAILVSLRLVKDSDRLVETFQTGVETTRELVGQADKMGAALSALSADTLRIQAALDGGIPAVVSSEKESKTS